MPPSDIQARCFSGLPFWKMFRRRDPATPPGYSHAIPSPPSNRGMDNVADDLVRILHAYNVFQTLNVVQEDSFFFRLEKDWHLETGLPPAYLDGDWNYSRLPTVLGPEFVNTIESELNHLSREFYVHPDLFILFRNNPLF